MCIYVCLCVCSCVSCVCAGSGPAPAPYDLDALMVVLSMPAHAGGIAGPELLREFLRTRPRHLPQSVHTVGEIARLLQVRSCTWGRAFRV